MAVISIYQWLSLKKESNCWWLFLPSYWNWGFESYQEVYFQELQEDSGLYSFQVEEKKDYTELQVDVRSYKMVEGRFLFANGHFYQVHPLQKSLIDAIQDLPIDTDRKRRVQFDGADQTKLTYSLEKFRLIGSIQAPEKFVIHDFQPRFHFDLSQDQEVLLDLEFVFSDRKINSRNELEKLPYSGNFDKERQVFETMLVAGFTDQFQTKRAPLLPQQVYSFFNQTLPLFELLGPVQLSDALLDLYHVEKPKVSIQTSGRLLEIGFDFDSVDPAEVDQVLSALIEANDYYVSKAGKLLIFDEETKKISQILLDLRAKKTKDGQLQTNRIAAFQLSQLFEKSRMSNFLNNFAS